MSITYTPATNFGAKDSLPTNDPDKVIKGSEFTTEFTAIQTAFGLAAPAASPTFTGTVTISSVDINGGAIDGTIIGGTTPAAGTFSSLTATTADINGGTIDGVTIGGSSAGAITGTTGQFNTSLNVDGTITADGGTIVSTGSDAFSSKAVGGYAIQAYQDATSSGHTALDLRSDATTGTRYLIRGYNDAAGTPTEVFSVGADGTVTADGLTSDGNVSVVGAANTRTIGFDFYGSSKYNFYMDGSTDADRMFIRRGATNVADFASTGDISFYEDTGTTPKFFWDASAERLGIGTTSPDRQINVGSNGTSSLGFAWTGDNVSKAYIDVSHITGEIQHGAVTNYFPTFYSSGSERMRIDSSGNVGIGTTSPATKLSVQGDGLTVRLDGTANTSRGIFLRNTGTGEGVFQTDGNMHFLQEDASKYMRFSTANTEAMRIDSSGNLLVGTTTPGEGISYGASGITTIKGTYGAMIKSTGGTGGYEALSLWNEATSGTITQIVFRDGASGASRGTVTTNGSTTSYNTSSDARLKENIADAEDAGAKVDAIQVRQFDWIADGSHQDYGMIAQELMTVAPEAVSGDPESDEMMGVDYSKLVPMLVKEIQSLRARVAQLEGV